MVSCKICGSRDTAKARLGDAELIFCKTCTVTFLASLPSEPGMKEYYESAYRITAPDDPATEKRRFFRWPEQIKLIAQLMRLKPPPAAVLDVGCDKAYFLDEIRRYGYRVSGVEPSKTAREYCRQIGIETHGSIDELNATYDIITLWHTLEHVGDPVGFLRRVHALMNQRGVLAIRVPNFDNVWRRIFRARWIWYQPQNHCFHYTAAALHRLLTLVGFKSIQIKSQRPNNRLTRKAYGLAAKTFKAYRGDRVTFKKLAGRIYEDVTGIELYALAVKE